MKTILVIAVGLVGSALAQTTQTNCSVIGNQIYCTSQTAPPVPALQLQPVQPVSPALIQALAERRAHEFAAAERARQSALAKFQLELSAPDVWTDLRYGQKLHVRMAQEHIYLQLIPNPALPAGAYASQDCQPTGTSWACIGHSVWPYPQRRSWKWCQRELHSTRLTSVSLDRIEYEVDSIDSYKDFDVKHCEPKRTTHKTITLIPLKAGVTTAVKQ